MLKIVLSFFVAISSSYYSNEFVTKVERIEYDNNYENNFVNLKIKIKAYSKDIVELKIYICDKNKNIISNNYYSSVLNIEKEKNTIAKIPLTLNEKIFLNIEIYSDNLGENIVDIMFPIYPKKDAICNFDETKLCKSNNPVYIVYENEKITEKYEEIFLINQEMKIENFDNILDLSEIKILHNLTILEGKANLYLSEKIDNFHIRYDDYYTFPLKLNKVNNVIGIMFMEYYYIDVINGKVYENYFNNTNYDNKLIMPYEENKYSFHVEIFDYFCGFEKIVFHFDVITTKGLVGSCNLHKYCLRRNYL